LGRGCRISRARRAARIAYFCIISNVDLEIEQRDFLTRLEARLGEDRMGIIAPSIRSRLTSVEQNRFFAYATRLKMHGYRWLFASYPIAATCERFSRYERCCAAGVARNSLPSRQTSTRHTVLSSSDAEFFSEGAALSTSFSVRRRDPPR